MLKKRKKRQIQADLIHQKDEIVKNSVSEEHRGEKAPDQGVIWLVEVENEVVLISHFSKFSRPSQPVPQQDIQGNHPQNQYHATQNPPKRDPELPLGSRIGFAWGYLDPGALEQHDQY